MTTPSFPTTAQRRAIDLVDTAAHMVSLASDLADAQVYSNADAKTALGIALNVIRGDDFMAMNHPQSLRGSIEHATRDRIVHDFEQLLLHGSSRPGEGSIAAREMLQTAFSERGIPCAMAPAPDGNVTIELSVTACAVLANILGGR
jgi:hypothetical protein